MVNLHGVSRASLRLRCGSPRWADFSVVPGGTRALGAGFILSIASRVHAQATEVTSASLDAKIDALQTVLTDSHDFDAMALRWIFLTLVVCAFFLGVLVARGRG